MEDALSRGRIERYVKLKEVFSKITGFTQKDALHDLERLEELMAQIPKVANELEYRGLVDKRNEIDANFEYVDGKNMLAEIFGIVVQGKAIEVEQEQEVGGQKIEDDEITLKEGVLAFGRSIYRGAARMNAIALASLITNNTEMQGLVQDDENIAVKKVSKNAKEVDRGVKYFLRDMSGSVIARIEKSMDKDARIAQYTDIKDVLNQITIEENDENEP